MISCKIFRANTYVLYSCIQPIYSIYMPIYNIYYRDISSKLICSLNHSVEFKIKILSAFPKSEGMRNVNTEYSLQICMFGYIVYYITTIYIYIFPEHRLVNDSCALAELFTGYAMSVSKFEARVSSVSQCEIISCRQQGNANTLSE